jgi:serine/threonine protein kinase
MIGKTISHYKILEKLGEGGMGVVYKAQDTKLERTVAIKFLPRHISSSSEDRERFKNEAKVAAALTHTNIATIHSIEETDEEMFIVMEFVDGIELRNKIQSGLIQTEGALEIATQIAKGLEAAHKKGIIHRDIKSSNIMLTNDNSVKIMDFGLAKLLGGKDLTKIGTAIGTAGYMSPEQAQGTEIDHRSDIWSLGVLIYEMICGELPFTGEYEQVVLYSIINNEPKPLSELRGDISSELESIINKMMEKEPANRYGSIKELLADIKKLSASESPTSQPSIQEDSIFEKVAKRLFGWDKNKRKIDRAKEQLEEIEQLVQTSKYFKAYDLAMQVEEILKKDPNLDKLLPTIADKLNVTTEPKGAKVFIKRFLPDASGNFPDKEFIGNTPILNMRIARCDYIVFIEKDGYAPAERIASSSLLRAEASLGISTDIIIDIKLIPSDENPEDMVFVPAGKYKLVSYGAPTDQGVQLDDFFLDKYAVSNKHYKSFIIAGGYSNKEYWKYHFVKEGKSLEWKEAMKHLLDKTGLPGPRSWINQDYTDGKENYPVTDICWYEAAAYAEYVDKKLPTIYEWEKAARNGEYTHFVGMVMPWGLMHPKESSHNRANFSGRETLETDSYEFGISQFGCYNMAGNVKEWCLNEMTDGYATTGGSWQDPIYMWGDIGVFNGFFTESNLGFRCAKHLKKSKDDQGGMRIDIDNPTPQYEPVEESIYNGFLSHFRYDKKDLNAEVIETKETEDWVKEKITFSGEGNDRIIAYLYLPQRAQKPFQCITFIPGGDVFISRNLAQEAEWILGPHIKAGRALFTVVMKGMTEREWDMGYSEPDANSVEFRNLMVLHSTELNRGLDYLETRSEINIDKISYIGFSWGCGTRLAFAGIINRFKSNVFIGGGIDERMLPTLPEVNPVNYAPYIKVPKLLLNGKQDEEHIYKTRALPLYNLLKEPKKLALVDGGHLPSLEVRVPIINNFLDETLGTVKFT